MEWHGLEVEIPPVPLSSVILRAGRLRDDDWEGAVRLLEAIVGPQMFGRIMDRMDEKNMVGDEGLTELGKLIGEVFNIYGFTPGESQASRSS